MKVTLFDTESTDLAASWGRILCCSFHDLGEGDNVTTFRGDVKPHRRPVRVDDSKLCIAIRDRLETADMIVGWNSILHDVPLLNARLAVAGERPLNPRKHLDLMFYAGGVSLKVGGRRLDTVAKFFKVPNQKTPLDGDMWQRAAVGDKTNSGVPAMDYIVEHCEADVLVLRDLWPHLFPFVKKFQLPLSSWGDVDIITRISV